MLALGIDYLNGWAMATHPAQRERPEWPPHPDRVFMALAAAYFETDGDATERAALEWLERQAPPRVIASRHVERDTVTTFVPINDTADPIKKGKSLMPSGSMPIGRDRQPRQFPVAIPAAPQVYLVWDDAEPTHEQRTALDRLCGKLTYIGHSASLVRAWVADWKPEANQEEMVTNLQFRPTDGAARFRLRIFTSGRLANLESQFNRAAVEQHAELVRALETAKGKQKQAIKAELDAKFPVEPQSLRPTSGIWKGYEVVSPRPPMPRATHSHFQPALVVLRQVIGPRFGFGLESTLQLTDALRKVVMSRCGLQPPPEWVSGHVPEGGKSKREGGHLALIPLPHVGRPHADGHLLGLAIAIPRDVPQIEVARCLNPLLFDEHGWPRSFSLPLGRLGQCELQLDDRSEFRAALQPETWTAAVKPSRRWSTVTPIALDRHAKSDTSATEIESSIATSCERIGLPKPIEVILSPVSLFVGAPAACQMPRIERKNNGGRIRHTHAIICFPEPIVGPVLLGAGRFRGYGLCRPVLEEVPS